MEHAAGRTAADMAAAEHELEALRWDWGDAYEIEHGEEHGWRAKRLDGLGGWLTAPGPDEMYGVIAADYALKPVPRSAAPGERS
ncbi:MAG TPA: hypothetical protein VHT26_12645 [Trebonia sp.]|jgi:hypothetical protein|nr:hypothetical protein [Trebonia sp.]